MLPTKTALTTVSCLELYSVQFRNGQELPICLNSLAAFEGLAIMPGSFETL